MAYWCQAKQVSFVFTSWSACQFWTNKCKNPSNSDYFDLKAGVTRVPVAN